MILCQLRTIFLRDLEKRSWEYLLDQSLQVIGLWIFLEEDSQYIWFEKSLMSFLQRILIKNLYSSGVKGIQGLLLQTSNQSFGILIDGTQWRLRAELLWLLSPRLALQGLWLKEDCYLEEPFILYKEHLSLLILIWIYLLLDPLPRAHRHSLFQYFRLLKAGLLLLRLVN